MAENRNSPSIYFSEELDWDRWRSRYPAWCRGGEQWVHQSYDNNGNWNPPNLPPPTRLPERVSLPLSQQLSQIAYLRRPRVFVSHRRKDLGYADRITYLADQAGFYFWLDAVNLPPPAVIKKMSARTFAWRIEMALLNCSHVVAVYTDRTKGSTWVPYEYGRVKEPVLSSMECCTWLYVNQNTYVPEWVQLNAVCLSERQLINWFRRERIKWENNFGITLPNGPTGQWTGTTKPLPK